MIWATVADRRRTLRRPLGHLAVIMAEPGAPLSTPPRVSTSHDFEVPNLFILRLSGEEATYKVIWRKGRQVGAKLVSRAAPKRLTRYRGQSH